MNRNEDKINNDKNMRGILKQIVCYVLKLC